jgi:hypothetical protein
MLRTPNVTDCPGGMLEGAKVSKVNTGNWAGGFDGVGKGCGTA